MEKEKHDNIYDIRYRNIYLTILKNNKDRKLICTELNALNRFVGWCWCIKTKTTLILTEMFYIQYRGKS